MSIAKQVEPVLEGKNIYLSLKPWCVRTFPEFFPKKLDSQKFLASGLFSVLASSTTEPASYLNLSSRPDLRLGPQTRPWLHMDPYSLTQILNLVHAQPCPSLLLASAQGEEPFTSTHLHTSTYLQRLALTLEGKEPEAHKPLLLQSLDELREHNSSQAQRLDSHLQLCPELRQERPGKLRPWLLAATREQAFLARYHAISKESMLPPGGGFPKLPHLLGLGAGWACTLIATHKSSGLTPSLHKAVHTARLCATFGEFLGDTLQSISELSLSWARSYEATSTKGSSPGQPLDAIYVLSPYLSILSGMRTALQEALPAPSEQTCKLHFPDLLGGWSQTLSLLNFLNHAGGQALLVDFTHFPEVQLALSQPMGA